jgi:hypothetical protein
MQYEHLKVFIINNKRYPSRSKDKTEKSLNMWVKNNRKKYKNKTLSNDKITKLESLENFQWNVFVETWIDNFNQLKLYVDVNKEYPNWNNKNEKSLNTWISTNRKKYKNKKLSNDKITKLETLKNFQWNAIKETWISNFNQLKLYIDDNKGYPNKYSKIESEKSLGLWVYTNKQNYKNNKLSNDKIEKLKTLKNWIWKGKLKKITAKQISLESKIVTKQVNIRSNQSNFRSNIEHKYNNICPFTQEDNKLLLNACHIVPYSTLKNRNISEEIINSDDNGILLDVRLHILFDNYAFTIDHDGAILTKDDTVKRICILDCLLDYDDNEFFQEHRANYTLTLESNTTTSLT